MFTFFLCWIDCALGWGEKGGILQSPSTYDACMLYFVLCFLCRLVQYRRMTRVSTNADRMRNHSFSLSTPNTHSFSSSIVFIPWLVFVLNYFKLIIIPEFYSRILTLSYKELPPCFCVKQQVWGLLTHCNQLVLLTASQQMYDWGSSPATGTVDKTMNDPVSALKVLF